MHQQSGWSFLTGHARMLLVVARDPAACLCDIAAACHITERTVRGIVVGLEQAGCLSRERHGRRTRYTPRWTARGDKPVPGGRNRTGPSPAAPCTALPPS
ncbi:hypothetical protein FBY35_0333 [Streptomyces sp. SLBN-118]|uniref:BlaI/MecI/CopY family transcriptional regulator n=1 Tax=Streptomyces sp. SLBN-118 TaxID=2768454 RepID=UPI0011510A05|nr:BlaI/MecI/CopY family transcriptional regulator [Streptomyces sp. SLBN-118]TQK50038.1 hypothetical protein FBY35_0333 [Streptomyces sp. SLBN-118]